MEARNKEEEEDERIEFEGGRGTVLSLPHLRPSVRPSIGSEGGRGEGATGIACAPTFALHPPASLLRPSNRTALHSVAAQSCNEIALHLTVDGWMDGRREGGIRDAAALSFSRAVDAARHSYFDVDAPACDASSVVDSLPHHCLLLAMIAPLN